MLTFLGCEIHGFQVCYHKVKRICIREFDFKERRVGDIRFANGVGVDNRVARDATDVVVGRKHRLVVHAVALEHGFDMFVVLTAVEPFLITHNVGVFTENITHQAVIAIIIILIFVAPRPHAKTSRVISHHLQTLLRSRRGKVDGEVLVNGGATQEQSHKGNP